MIKLHNDISYYNNDFVLKYTEKMLLHVAAGISNENIALGDQTVI